MVDVELRPRLASFAATAGGVTRISMTPSEGTSPITFTYTRSFHRTRLPEGDQQRCFEAIEQFGKDPRYPSLNYERLGHGSVQNHCSIRASEELRVILAVAPVDFDRPTAAVLVHMGHHDPAYEWSKRQNFHTSIDEVRRLPDSAPRSTGPASLAAAWDDVKDLEEWMLFLHPDQMPLVTRQYSGEARVRGGAGTGKTVVALHRTAELGRRYADQRILFTTFSRSLTDSMASLFRRLPDAPSNVDFVNIDRLAARLTPSLRVDPDWAKGAFGEAYKEVAVGTSLASAGPEYVRTEIERLMKGRGASRSEYTDTDRFERLGRLRKFRKADRELCWELREVWDRKMHDAGIVDFADRLLLARDAARADGPSYRAVVIDEAQDLTVVGMQLARAVVAGAETEPVPNDGLVLFEDSAQRIYKGGTRLAWAGLNVKGRSEVLGTNYRNTAQVLRAARAVRGTKLAVKDDNDDGAAWPEVHLLPDGPKPVLIRVDVKREAPTLYEEIERLRQEEGIALAHMAVLTTFNDDVSNLQRYLGKRGCKCTALAQNEPDQGVRVGTFDRAKGREFEAVLIPRLGQSVFPRPPDASRSSTEGTAEAEVEAEARQGELDRLYVGMTRARRWLVLVADEPSCREIEGAWETIERRAG